MSCRKFNYMHIEPLISILLLMNSLIFLRIGSMYIKWSDLSPSNQAVKDHIYMYSFKGNMYSVFVIQQYILYWKQRMILNIVTRKRILIWVRPNIYKCELIIQDQHAVNYVSTILIISFFKYKLEYKLS